MVLGLAAFLSGCGGGPAQPQLEGGAGDIETLGARVWTALVTVDTASLERLRLSEYEHNELIWPEQPAAREPSAAANLDFWWQNIQLRNRSARDRLVARYHGSELGFSGVACPGAPRSFRTYTARTDCRLRLRGPDGEHEVRAFRHVIEMGGRYKVVRYDGG